MNIECFERIKEQIARQLHCEVADIKIELFNDQKLYVDIQGLSFVLELYYCPICRQKLNHRE
jgi:hypothetical protein